MHIRIQPPEKYFSRFKKKNIMVSRKALIRARNVCAVCARKDRKQDTSCQYVEASEPGEKIGIDILEIKPGDLILVGIDYFSRRLFAKSIQTKEAIKTAEFLMK